MVMHGDARWCLIMMHDHASSGLVPYRSLRMIKYDQNVFFVGGRWGEWMGVVGKGILESTFTILYIQIEPYRMVLFFWLKTTNKSTKWLVVFWKMPIHRSQVGLVLQNGLVFCWWHVHRWVYVLNNFTKWFCFFRKMKKHLIVFKRSLLNSLKYFWVWPQIGVGFTKWFWFFSKKNEFLLQNGLLFCLGKCQLFDSKMIEPYRMVFKIPGNLKLFLQNGW